MCWCAYVCGYPILAGVGIGVVDVGYERRLANHLGAHRTPSILGVINGKVTFFHYAVAKEHLRQFVEDLLPQRLVERVNIRLSSEKKNQSQSIRGRKTKTFLLCMSVIHFAFSQNQNAFVCLYFRSPTRMTCSSWTAGTSSTSHTCFCSTKCL